METLVAGKQNVKIIDLAELAVKELKGPETIRKFQLEYAKLLRGKIKGIGTEPLANVMIATCATKSGAAAMQL